MYEMTNAPTAEDTVIRALVHAQMDDGAAISTAVKVDTMLDHLGIENAPTELKRLLIQGINYRLVRSRRKGRGVAPMGEIASQLSRA